MRFLFITLVYASTLLIAFWLGLRFDSSASTRELYKQDLDSRITRINVTLGVLNLLREQEYRKAISGLETSMLMDAAGSPIDERILGQSREINIMAKNVSEYCLKYKVFDNTTNLPSHRLAKQFLDSHFEDAH